MTSDVSIDGLEQFHDHKDMFEKLTNRRFINTKQDAHHQVDLDIVSMLITYNAKHALAICNKQDWIEKVDDKHDIDRSHIELQAFDLKTYEKKLCRVFEGTYLKANVIE